MVQILEEGRQASQGALEFDSEKLTNAHDKK